MRRTTILYDAGHREDEVTSKQTCLVVRLALSDVSVWICTKLDPWPADRSSQQAFRPKKSGIVKHPFPSLPSIRPSIRKAGVPDWLPWLQIVGLPGLLPGTSTLRRPKPCLANASENFREALRVELPALLRQKTGRQHQRAPPSKRRG